MYITNDDIQNYFFRLKFKPTYQELIKVAKVFCLESVNKTLGTSLNLLIEFYN